MNVSVQDSNLKEIQLSTRGLKGPASLGIEDFTFSVCGFEYKCSKFEASFLSPHIAELLSNDSGLNEYEIDCPGYDDDVFSFPDFLSLARGSALILSGRNSGAMKMIAKSLRNHELYEALCDFQIGAVELSPTNVFERLSLRSSFDMDCHSEIEYIASHFYEVDRDLLKSMDAEFLKRIVSSDCIRLRDEDFLLDFILDIGMEGIGLLCYVQSEYLSVSGIDRLLNAVSFDSLDTGLWTSLCRRLRFPIMIRSRPTSRFPLLQFGFDSSHPFAGIISHLTSECGGNIHTKGIVSITASSTESNACHQVADHNWNGWWYSNNVPNSWIQFDFKSRSVYLTHYTIKSDGNLTGANHLSSWSIEGSHDGQHWEALDRRHTQELNGPFRVCSYECQVQTGGVAFRYVRLIQTGKNISRTDYLLITNLEFFGRIDLN
jgi:hypothetical protein